MLRILVISLFVANLLLLGFRDDKPVVEPEQKAARTVIKNNNIPTIHLFSEMMEDQDLLSGNRQCFSLGPFHTIEDKDETRLLLLEVSTRISERQTQAMVEKGYWVFMPPYESLLAANQALFALQALGLEDIGIVYDGEMKNGISMGYFMRQENALRRKKGLEDRGYEPMIRVQRQPESRYWLDYEQTPGSGLVKLDMQSRPNDFMQRPLPCPQEDLFEPTALESNLAEADIAPVEEAGAEDDGKSGEETGADTVETIVTTDANVPVEAAEEEDDAQPGEGFNTDAADSTETVADAGIDDPESVEDLSENNIDAIPEEGAETVPEEGAETAQEEGAETEPEAAAETEPEPDSENGTGEG